MQILAKKGTQIVEVMDLIIKKEAMEMLCFGLLSGWKL